MARPAFLIRSANFGGRVGLSEMEPVIASQKLPPSHFVRWRVVEAIRDSR
jgi:hypothetical protein